MADFRVINGAPLANRHRGQADGARPMKTASILFLFLLAIELHPVPKTPS